MTSRESTHGMTQLNKERDQRPFVGGFRGEAACIYKLASLEPLRFGIDGIGITRELIKDCHKFHRWDGQGNTLDLGTV